AWRCDRAGDSWFSPCGDDAGWTGERSDAVRSSVHPCLVRHVRVQLRPLPPVDAATSGSRLTALDMRKLSKPRGKIRCTAHAAARVMSSARMLVVDDDRMSCS